MAKTLTEYIGPGKAAEMLRLSRGSVHNWVRDGVLTPAATVDGNKLLFTKEQIERLASLRNKPIVQVND